MQKNFIFSQQFKNIIPKGYLPDKYLTAEDEFIDRMNKKGYLVKSVVKMDTIVGLCAKANIPLNERKKFQEQLNKEKKQSYIII